MKQLPAEGAELLVVQFDHMKVIEHVHRSPDVLANGSDVGGRNVRGNRLDLGVGTTQPFPEKLEGIHAFAIADEDDGTSFQIEHDGQIPVPLADVDFIDGNLLELVQLGLAEAALEIPGLDVLDRVPANGQVVSDILDGHQPRELQGVAFEGMRVMFLGIGKGDLDLPQLVAVVAKHTR